MKLPGFAALLITFGGTWFGAGAQNALPPCSTSRSAAGPCVDKVDPPSWFASLPSPLLLLHGQNLGTAQFSVSGPGITVRRSQASANGHYAFLWLATENAAPQTLQIHIADQQGSTSVPFVLQPRRPAAHAGFSALDVMYLIMTDRFADGDPANDPQTSERSQPRGWHGGDFRGVRGHLDYLADLGVSTVWLTPVYDNDGGQQAYHGYSATNLYATDPHFGTLDDLRSLADALHRRGMKLVLDTVPNHVGAAHPWAADPPTPNWFHGTRASHVIAAGNFQDVIDPHATWKQKRDVTEGWFANVLPDLNQENPLVRQYLIQNVMWWVESTGADGLRYDTFPYVGRAFWQALNGELKTLYPHLTTVGEVFDPNPVITSYFAGGVTHAGIDTELGTPFDFPTQFALRAVFTHPSAGSGAWLHHEDFTHLESVLSEDWLYPHPERLVTFIGNHDTTRFLSMPGATVPDLKVALALLATLRGMPQIYSGDEIAMRGGGDPDNRHDFPGGFPGDPQNAFTAAGRTLEQADVHDRLKTLLRFRRRHAVLATGLEQDILVDPTTFVFARAANLEDGCKAGVSAPMLIAVNDGDQAREVQFTLEHTALEGCSVFTGAVGATGEVRASGETLTLTLPAKQAEIYEAR
ncbi:MAG TPA: alpha-amylase family glycosyl hydrolase [Acidobacteriaceae bacterium]